MSNSLFFSKDHEWIEVDGDVATIGISEFAADELGDVVFVELPEVGTTLSAGDKLAVVESVKAVSDVMAPVSVEITEVITELEDAPDLLSQDAEGNGWIAKVRVLNGAELSDLMDRNAYDEFLKEGGH